MRILIIEDEIKTANYLATGLRSHGFLVIVAHDGKSGLFLATEYDFDLVILDVMLPKVDGWTIIQKLLVYCPTIRVLFLTARDSIQDKVKGFELGADDYLIKPFAFSELLGRVKAILRRSVSPKKDKISIADLEIDLLKHKITRGRQTVELTAQEFSLLLYMAEHAGEVLSRTQIAEAVWGINFNTETNVVDVAIRRLRQKIDASFEKQLIHTLRGVGYILEAR